MISHMCSVVDASLFCIVYAPFENGFSKHFYYTVCLKTVAKLPNVIIKQRSNRDLSQYSTRKQVLT